MKISTIFNFFFFLKLLIGAMEKIDGHKYELVVKDQNGGKSLGW